MYIQFYSTVFSFSYLSLYLLTPPLASTIVFFLSFYYFYIRFLSYCLFHTRHSFFFLCPTFTSTQLSYSLIFFPLLFSLILYFSCIYGIFLSHFLFAYFLLFLFLIFCYFTIFLTILYSCLMRLFSFMPKLRHPVLYTNPLIIIYCFIIFCSNTFFDTVPFSIPFPSLIYVDNFYFFFRYRRRLKDKTTTNKNMLKLITTHT